MSSPLYLHFFLIINLTDRSQLLVLQNSAPSEPKQCSWWLVGSYGGPLTQTAWEQFMDSFQCPIWKLFLPPHADKTCDVITLKGLTTLVRSQINHLIEACWSFAQSLQTKMNPEESSQTQGRVNQAHCTETHLHPALEVHRPVSPDHQSSIPGALPHINVSSHSVQTWSWSL